MSPGKPGKSWNFTVAFSRSQKILEKGLLVLKSAGKLLNSSKKKRRNVWETVRRIKIGILESKVYMNYRVLEICFRKRVHV